MHLTDCCKDTYLLINSFTVYPISSSDDRFARLLLAEIHHLDLVGSGQISVKSRSPVRSVLIVQISIIFLDPAEQHHFSGSCRISIIFPDPVRSTSFCRILSDQHHFFGSCQISIILSDPVRSASFCRILSDQHYFSG